MLDIRGYRFALAYAAASCLLVPQLVYEMAGLAAMPLQPPCPPNTSASRQILAAHLSWAARKRTLEGTFDCPVTLSQASEEKSTPKR